LRGDRRFAGTWRIAARILRKPAQYELELRLSRDGSERAHRTLRDSTCARLLDATAVLVALALENETQPAVEDAVPATSAGGPTAESSGAPALRENPASVQPENPSRAERAPPGAQGPAVSRQPAGARESAVERESSQPEAEELAIEPAAHGGARLRVGIGAGLRLDAGMLPALHPGVLGRVELGVDRLRAALGFSWLPPIEKVAAPYPAASIKAHAVLGDAWIGYAVLDGRLSLTPYAAFELGALSLESLGIRAPNAQSSRWTALGAGARGTYRAGAGFELDLEAAGFAPFSRPRLWVRTDRGEVTLFETAAVTVRLAASVSYVFE
jgi:hypothetical protein